MGRTAAQAPENPTASNLTALLVQAAAVFAAALLWFLGGSTWLWGDIVAHTHLGEYLVRGMHVRPPSERQLGQNASAAGGSDYWLTPQAAEEVEFGALCALTHTVLLLGGCSAAGWLRDVLRGRGLWQGVAPAALLAVAFSLLREAMRAQFERHEGAVYRYASRWWYDEGADSFALLAAGSMSLWLAAAVLIPYLSVGDGAAGALPASVAQYMVWLLVGAMGTFAFFGAAPRVFGYLSGDSPAAEAGTVLAGATHTAALCSGVAICSCANFMVRVFTGGWTEATASRSTAADLTMLCGLTALFSAVVAGVWWPALQHTDTVAAATATARSLLPLPKQQREALPGWAAYVASYSMWFAAGALFELSWPGSATNSYHRTRKPRRRSWAWRLAAVTALGAVAMAWDARKRFEEGGPLAQAAAVMAVITAMYIVTRPASGRGAKWGVFTGRDYAAPSGTERRRRLDALRKQCGEFPPPYPNGWYRACLSQELRPGGNPVSVSMVGTEIVLFRGEDGIAGALYAFCPHLGTHLGGGEVRGCRLVCPYHEWAFRADGKCEDIPYHPAGSKLPERANQRSFPTMERCGIVFIWYDAEKGQPWYELDEVETVHKASNGYRFVCDIPFGPDWLMHIMEPSQNSADWYHFNTVHRHLANPIHPQLLAVDHTLRAYFTEGVSGGSGPRDADGWERKVGADKMPPTHLYVRETITQIRIFNRVALPGFVVRFFDTCVKIQGPQTIVFCLDTAIGSFRAVTTLQPLEPFRQRGRMRVFVNGFWPGWLARIIAHLICETANQDREVWEHKMHIAPRNLVAGDGPFVAYGHWLKQFYTDSSTLMKDAALGGTSRRCSTGDW